MKDHSLNILTPSLLYTREGMVVLQTAFEGYLHQQADSSLVESYKNALRSFSSFSRLEESTLILQIAPYLERFLGQLFDIETSLDAYYTGHQALGPLIQAKRQFVQRFALKKYSLADAMTWDADAISQDVTQILGGAFDEVLFAEKVLVLLAEEVRFTSALDTCAKYAAWATLTPQGKVQHKRGILFKAPQKLDLNELVKTQKSAPTSGSLRHVTSHNDLRARNGFTLTDAGLERSQAIDQAHYCIWCHEQGKDSCSKGMKDKATQKFTQNAAGVMLTGCPLEEKISEMNYLKARGYALAALAVITIDNPMVAATGHRICNDCMKACIYQKQEPVNIPGVETQILREVLSLPWGFEIYSLLTRWNPLNFRRPLPHDATPYKVLVVGMGPAGFTLAHHLLNDGHMVVGVDGLKIEPLPAHLSGVTPTGERVPFDLVHDASSLFEDLDERIIGGFGGVAEYGITVRWDKNFLKLVRLLLERRHSFTLFDGVRLGGTLTLEQAFEEGFDHVALCMGAGKPTLIPMKNGLARGVRQASDFLMALQLTGANRRDSITNLQVRLPVIVIGGGLTAIDTATEALAYYPLQIEKFATRYYHLVAQYGKQAVEASWTEEDKEIAAEFLTHAAALTEEHRTAHEEGRPPRITELLQKWGGATIAYRRRLQQSPSYTLNHEEVEKALEEGIVFHEGLTPQEVEVDAYGHLAALKVVDQEGQLLRMPAKTLLIAAGTHPNTVLAREDTKLVIEGRTFQALDECGHVVTAEKIAKPEYPAVFTHFEEDGRSISFFGDLHPSFAGNVVKAMASAKQGYPLLTRALRKRPPTQVSQAALLAKLNEGLRPTVVQVIPLAPRIVEVIVKAPFAARAFQPGQFYRLQNYETNALVHEGTRFAMEGLALTGASVNKEEGMLSTIVLEMGGSSDLCRYLTPGERVVFMGPTGTPTKILPNTTVALVGGGLGNAVLFSIGQALRAQGTRVIYFAGYRVPEDRVKQEEIEAASDVVVWCCDQGPALACRRPQDRSFVGNILEGMYAYAQGHLGMSSISLSEVKELIVIGSDRMMAAVARACIEGLAPYLTACTSAIASINSPMQCMMKEICAQCLQRHVDPVTGVEKIVFSCVNQDQPLSDVDFDSLKTRLIQNQVQEKLTKEWIRYSLAKRDAKHQATYEERG